MAKSQWHSFYNAKVAAQPAALFELLSDMPNYRRWLPQSDAFGETTDVVPYPVQLGSRYHDGKPAEPGKDWWGTVIGFQPPGSIDFHHIIHLASCGRRLTCTFTIPSNWTAKARLSIAGWFWISLYLESFVRSDA